SCYTGPLPPDFSALSLHDALPIYFFTIGSMTSILSPHPTRPFPDAAPFTRASSSFITPCATACSKPSTPAKAAAKKFSSLATARSEEHTSELQSLAYLVCRLLLEK